MNYPDLDLLRPDLDVIFIGFNPSLYSAEVMHHYASKSNRFWRILYQAGITDRLYMPSEDGELLEKGFGFTNIVHRPTKAAAEITAEEYQTGKKELLNKLLFYQPKIACFVGKGVYLSYSGKKKADWGLQPDSIARGVMEFTAPSSSGLVRMKQDEIVGIYKELTKLLKEKQALK
ncbi:mismatch-specific DNA-glycosylase [Peribacillus frigoritolerans]|uniref:mismatch-specific DNA-glycosylase n=1 Tax=Peribacillus frigoritolerans TaxID=450367 RepID=UPI00105A36A8|nr:mismatch-specific DNA-glycosylase [Peribacillus frigoritolerans]TDL82962.1 mismatch-specific DNA-glycosylase [Peribacillus frigoritolerans]